MYSSSILSYDNKLALSDICQSYTQRPQYQQAQDKTQGKRKADRWKIDCERRREEHKTLLNAHQIIPSTVL